MLLILTCLRLGPTDIRMFPSTSLTRELNMASLASSARCPYGRDSVNQLRLPGIPVNISLSWRRHYWCVEQFLAT